MLPATPFLKRLLRPATALLALSVLSLSCQLNLGGPPPPGPPITASDTEAKAFQETWESALARGQASDGEVRLIVNEEQLTSLIRVKVSQREEPLLLDPKVYLRDGLIQVHGIADRGFLRANVLIGIEPVISADGGLSFRLTSAEFGPMPVPESIREGVSALITEAFTGSIGPYATGIRLDAVAINGGEMAISGAFR